MLVSLLSFMGRATPSPELVDALLSMVWTGGFIRDLSLKFRPGSCNPHLPSYLERFDHAIIHLESQSEKHSLLHPRPLLKWTFE